MQSVLDAQANGADFPTVLHLLAQHLELTGRSLAKVVDTAHQYVSYCSNPSLLESHRDCLDWIMLLFFVMNNNTSTYEDGTKNVPKLNKIIEILQNGPIESADFGDVTFCLTALLRQSLFLNGSEKALQPVIEAFVGFNRRMTGEFLSGKRPDTTLEDYIALRRTTIATFWWRDILVSFLGKPVNYDESILDAIADAVWLGNDIRSLHRDESNILDFIDEKELLKRLEDAYKVLDLAFTKLSPIHREVICLMVVGTSAIYPAMEKYGGSRYACSSSLAMQARDIHIKYGLSLLAKTSSLAKFPLISDALNEWPKSLDGPNRVMQQRRVFGKVRCALGFNLGRLDLRSSMCRVNLANGMVAPPNGDDELFLAARILWSAQHMPALEGYLDKVEDALVSIKCPSLPPLVEEKDLPLLLALTTLFPHQYLLQLTGAFRHLDIAKIESVVLCNALCILLEYEALPSTQLLERGLTQIEIDLNNQANEIVDGRVKPNPEFKYPVHFMAFWSLACASARLCMCFNKSPFQSHLTRFASCLNRVIPLVDDSPKCEIGSHGCYQMVIDKAICKQFCGIMGVTRDLVCINGVLSTSRMICEPIGELLFVKEGYVLASSHYSSLLGFAVVQTVEKKMLLFETTMRN